jgi:hypothetical protein
VRHFIVAAALAGATAALPSVAYADRIDSWRELENKRHECARKLNRADSRHEYNNRLEKCRRQIAEAQWRLERQGYRGRDDRNGNWGWNGQDRGWNGQNRGRNDSYRYRRGDWDD